MESQQQLQVPAPTSRNRLKGRLNIKGIPSIPIVANMRGIRSVAPQSNIGDLNKRITDLKMEGGGGQTRQTSLSDLQLRLQPFGEPRRDSNSTVSTYYGSMRSADLSSRRSSQASVVSAVRMGLGPESFYDPISPGTSRRSSQMSTTSSRIDQNHLQGPYSTNNLVVQTQNMSLQVCFMIVAQTRQKTILNDAIFLCRAFRRCQAIGIIQVVIVLNRQVIDECPNQFAVIQPKGLRLRSRLGRDRHSYPNFNPSIIPIRR